MTNRSRALASPKTSIIHFRTTANVAIVSAVTPDFAMTLTIVSCGEIASKESRMKSGSMLSKTVSRLRRLSTSRSEEHTSELQSRVDLVCRLQLEKKKI